MNAPGPISMSQVQTDYPLPNALSVDVEDYFQVQAFADTLCREDWAGQAPRVEQNMQRVLRLFSDAGVKGTFFTLGWIAERYPQLVREIVAQGHELASHGADHTQIFRQTRAQFSEDIRATKSLLEDVGGVPVKGYRAASFSLDGRSPWAHDALAEAGYRYSSSLYPIKHDLYGVPGGERAPYRTEAGITEIPLTTLDWMGRVWPVSGGGWFRLMPYGLFRRAWRRLHQQERRPAILYFHPWELDPEQPRVKGLSLKSRFRHYTNLSVMEKKLRRALIDFKWDRMDRVFSL